MQQILNAGLSYYVSYGSWPAQMSDLQGTFLPTAPMMSPWGEQYMISVTSTQQPLFYVWTKITTASATATASSATAAANIIAGTLPLSYTTTDSSGTSKIPPVEGSKCDETSTACYVVSSVNIPGQNLNNARAVNFAGIYHHGACVPVPLCPTTMTPQIMVVPVAVSGVNDPGSSDVYPISSFTAYATPTNNTPLNLTPPDCEPKSRLYNPSGACTPDSNSTTAAQAYWRVCLNVVTEKGDVSVTNTSTTLTDLWGKNVTLMAITRCAAKNEPAGSSFDMYSN
jgi:hypothetical protein